MIATMTFKLIFSTQRETYQWSGGRELLLIDHSLVIINSVITVNSFIGTTICSYEAGKCYTSSQQKYCTF